MENVCTLLTTNILDVQQPTLLAQCREFGTDKVAVAVEKCQMLHKREKWDRLKTTAERLVATLKSTKQALPREGAYWPRAMSVALAYQALAAAHAEDWHHVARHADTAFVVGGPQEFVEVAELAAAQLSTATEEGHSGTTTDTTTATDNSSTSMLDVPPPTTAPLEQPIKRIPAADLEHHLATDPDTPVVVEGLQAEWRAPSRWADVTFMMRKYGARSVPLEFGMWPHLTEDMLTLREFFTRYFSQPATSTSSGGNGGEGDQKPEVAYLAQHNLLEQIPALQADLAIPDVCSTHDRSLHEASVWWGSKGTVTPIHFDSFPNLLAQVVGYKYVRLFAPSESSKLYPFTSGSGDAGDDKGSTNADNSDGEDDRSARACEQAVEGGRYAGQSNISRVPDPRNVDTDRFPAMKDAAFVEAVLAPGDTLYMPRSHWHFVTSLSPSMSVNFWWKEGGA
ncbi:hypothetical protein PTSG_04999 [Salpingoeca rosetta]|uniref:JmjC domain-containing protein n=1 Tax=Salpingoeca rosetta (strain ATCC 50818 / BSB-021) TaxID=946362 RepID=F2U980_SALR5|nr:uncharacterized protein PTSG_04999 [Salpingoeca rosetta]EGD73283.1 hypothetical protein PTSG_04999 [Salpingoeca rosetta]|eukprot:XP_004994314.1 hypothetical protein PTSG_04999 [Salpingoeca rosetta]